MGSRARTAVHGFVAALAIVAAVTACASLEGLVDRSGVDCADGCPDGEADAPAIVDAVASDESSPPSTAPIVETITTGIDDALDFDVRPTDVLVLRAKPSRVDACAGSSCTPVVAADSMPAESTVMPPLYPIRSNASIAFFPMTGFGQLLIAQRGSDKCDTNCQTDGPDLPGLYSTSLPPGTVSMRRRGATIPLVFAKASRTTDGFLVGRPSAFAVAQESNNEAPSISWTSVFIVNTSLGFDVSVPMLFKRGSGGGGGGAQPFAFVAAKTPRGQGGYVAANGDFVDVLDAAVTTGIVPLLAAVTTSDPGAADLFARGTATADDSALTFHVFGTQPTRTLPFSGLSARASMLVATDRHVAWVEPGSADAGVAVTLHVCRADALLAETCPTPTKVTLPFQTLVRMRTSGSAIWAMGAALGQMKIVRVTLPSSG